MKNDKKELKTSIKKNNFINLFFNLINEAQLALNKSYNFGEMVGSGVVLESNEIVKNLKLLSKPKKTGTPNKLDFNFVHYDYFNFKENILKVQFYEKTNDTPLEFFDKCIFLTKDIYQEFYSEKEDINKIISYTNILNKNLNTLENNTFIYSNEIQQELNKAKNLNEDELLKIKKDGWNFILDKISDGDFDYTILFRAYAFLLLDFVLPKENTENKQKRDELNLVIEKNFFEKIEEIKEKTLSIGLEKLQESKNNIRYKIKQENIQENIQEKLLVLEVLKGMSSSVLEKRAVKEIRYLSEIFYMLRILNDFDFYIFIQKHAENYLTNQIKEKVYEILGVLNLAYKNKDYAYNKPLNNDYMFTSVLERELKEKRKNFISFIDYIQKENEEIEKGIFKKDNQKIKELKNSFENFGILNNEVMQDLFSKKNKFAFKKYEKALYKKYNLDYFFKSYINYDFSIPQFIMKNNALFKQLVSIEFLKEKENTILFMQYFFFLLKNIHLYSNDLLENLDSLMAKNIKNNKNKEKTYKFDNTLKVLNTLKDNNSFEILDDLEMVKNKKEKIERIVEFIQDKKPYIKNYKRIEKYDFFYKENGLNINDLIVKKTLSELFLITLIAILSNSKEVKNNKFRHVVNYINSDHQKNYYPLTFSDYGNKQGIFKKEWKDKQKEVLNKLENKSFIPLTNILFNAMEKGYSYIKPIILVGGENNEIEDFLDFFQNEFYGNPANDYEDYIFANDFSFYSLIYQDDNLFSKKAFSNERKYFYLKNFLKDFERLKKDKVNFIETDKFVSRDYVSEDRKDFTIYVKELLSNYSKLNNRKNMNNRTLDLFKNMNKIGLIETNSNEQLVSQKINNDVYILSCQYLTEVPEEILKECEVVYIDKPDLDELEINIDKIWLDINNRNDLLFFSTKELLTNMYLMLSLKNKYNENTLNSITILFDFVKQYSLKEKIYLTLEELLKEIEKIKKIKIDDIYNHSFILSFLFERKIFLLEMIKSNIFEKIIKNEEKELKEILMSKKLNDEDFILINKILKSNKSFYKQLNSIRQLLLNRRFLFIKNEILNKESFINNHNNKRNKKMYLNLAEIKNLLISFKEEIV